jgi:hypothetical protein
VEGRPLREIKDEVGHQAAEMLIQGGTAIETTELTDALRYH